MEPNDQPKNMQFIYPKIILFSYKNTWVVFKKSLHFEMKQQNVSFWKYWKGKILAFLRPFQTSIYLFWLKHDFFNRK